VLEHGSVFAVSVPRGEHAGTALPAVVTAAEELRGDSLLDGCRVWCVDDDPLVSRATHVLLERWGCQVQLSGNADEALARAAPGNAPDLLLLDVRMGPLSGPALLPLLQQRWQQAPAVILYTAEQDPALRALARENGWHFLSKQARTSALRALLTHACQRAR
jgi:histidine kinase